MKMADYTPKTSGTSTMVRNFYSDGMSYINIKFYNTLLSFSFHPFVSKDATGRSVYDNQKSLMTTVNWESAFAIYMIAEDIIYGRNTSPCSIVIPCASDASLILERRIIPMLNTTTPVMETIFSIKKNNEMIPFKFKTQQVQIIENGQSITKVVESGLGAFAKTIEGYLTGINSERHLNRLTDDYIKSQQGNQNNQYQSNSNNTGYQKKPWQKKQYNNYNSNNNPQPWESPQQNISTYQLP
jgi:hypothetical protein